MSRLTRTGIAYAARLDAGERPRHAMARAAAEVRERDATDAAIDRGLARMRNVLGGELVRPADYLCEHGDCWRGAEVETADGVMLCGACAATAAEAAE